MSEDFNRSDAPFIPRIDPAIWRLRPDFAALSIVVRDGENASSLEWVRERLAHASAAISTGPAWASAHLSSWQDAFRAFGAKPQRTPCSAEALRKRIERGGMLPPINAVVDIYNAVSVAYAVPVGGENIDTYVGTPHLTFATGHETFETAKDGAPTVEHPDAGEVIWRDDRGVTCRRWNWRQGPRTRITETTRSMWFVIERLEPMPIDKLVEAGDVLARDIRRLARGARIESQLLQAP
jgi:DNA/RNA-binding domain of Phe-tRNA-synthetase-like protein